MIGIDASRAVLSQRTGTENYSLNIIGALCAIHDRPPFRLYFPDGVSSSCLPPASLSVEHCPVAGRRLWTHLHLARELRRDPVELLFVPAHVVPITGPPAVVTVHDLGYLHLPDDHPTRQRAMLNASTRWNLRTARRIIAPSHFTAADIAGRYPGLESRIDVIHHGVSAHFRPAKSIEIERVQRRYKVGSPYILAVGTIQPRKNYPILAEAVSIHNRTYSDQPLSLVIVGRPGWQVEEVLTAIQPFEQSARVMLLHNIDDGELPALYSGAIATVQASRFEGFGMPILESMACGAPIIHADNSSMTEVAGNAALSFHTYDADHLAHRISEVRMNEELRLILSQRGLDRAKRFSWSQSASATLNSLQHALQQR